MYDKTITAERLNDLRNPCGKRKYTLLQLSEEIEKKTGVRISHTQLSNYEDNDPINKDKDIMNLKNVIALADFYDVSVDYLIGTSNSKSNDITIKTICDYTGLTEKSITVLKESQNLYKQSQDKSEPTRNNCITDIINKLLEFSVGDDYENQDGYYFYYDIVRYKKLIKCKEYIESNFQVFAPLIEFYNRATVHDKGYAVYHPENVKKVREKMEPFSTFEGEVERYISDMGNTDLQILIEHLINLFSIYENPIQWILWKYCEYEKTDNMHNNMEIDIAIDICKDFPNVLKETNHEALEYLKFSISKQFDKLLDEYVRDVTRPDLNKSIINSKL